MITVVAARVARRAVVRRHALGAGGPSARSPAGSRAPATPPTSRAMNAIAAPQILALVRGDGAVRAQAAVLAPAAARRLGRDGRRRASWPGSRPASLADGLAVYLALAAVIQVAVVVHDGRRRARPVLPDRGPAHQDRQRPAAPRLHRLRRSWSWRCSSSPLMLPVFSASAVLVTVRHGDGLLRRQARVAPPARRELGFSEAEERARRGRRGHRGDARCPRRGPRPSACRPVAYASRIISVTSSVTRSTTSGSMLADRVGLPVPVDRQPGAVERHERHRLEAARERRRRVGREPLVDARLDQDLAARARRAWPAR